MINQPNTCNILPDSTARHDEDTPLRVQEKIIAVPSVSVFDKLSASLLQQLLSDSFGRINNLQRKL